MVGKQILIKDRCGTHWLRDWGVYYVQGFVNTFRIVVNGLRWLAERDNCFTILEGLVTKDNAVVGAKVVLTDELSTMIGTIEDVNINPTLLIRVDWDDSGFRGHHGEGELIYHSKSPVAYPSELPLALPKTLPARYNVIDLIPGSEGCKEVASYINSLRHSFIYEGASQAYYIDTVNPEFSGNSRLMGCPSFTYKEWKALLDQQNNFSQNPISNGNEKSTKGNITQVRRPASTVTTGKRPTGTAIQGRRSRVTTAVGHLSYQAAVSF